MKDQYLGDFNDFIKFGLLRRLAPGHRVAVCWMLTGPDPRRHGRNRGYLKQTERWSGLDPDLYAALERINAGPLAVSRPPAENLLPGAFWFDELLEDDTDRDAWFRRFWNQAGPADLVLFDPDTGLEVPSVTKGAKGSSQYLYLDEVAEAYANGASLVIYRHWPHRNHDDYVVEAGKQLVGATRAPAVFVICSPHVAFFVVPQPKAAAELGHRAEAFAQEWEKARVSIKRYEAPQTEPTAGSSPLAAADDIGARLVLIHNLFADALAMADRPDGPSRMQSAILADMAVETAVKTLAAHMGLDVRRERRINDVVSSISPPLDTDRFHAIRDLRNNAVHGGSVPDPLGLEVALGAARSILIDVYQRFGYDFTHFNCVSLVKNPVVREELDAANSRLDDPKTALHFVGRALHCLDGLLQETIGAASGIKMWMFRNPRWECAQLMTACADGREEEVIRLLQATAAVALTPNLTGLAWLRSVVPRLPDPRVAVDDEAPEIHYSREDAENALALVAFMAYSLERRCPHLEQPWMAPRERKWLADCLPLVIHKQVPDLPSAQPEAHGDAREGEPCAE